MGIVSGALRNLIARQVDESGLVVWYDPERDYEGFVRRLDLPDTRVECFEGSFFALRHRIELLLTGTASPRLLVYVPVDPLAAGSALVELEFAGVVLRPGQQPPARNTKLSLLARNALKAVLGPEAAAAVEKQVEDPGLSLDELDRLGERGAGLRQAVLPLIFHTDNPTEIALCFLHDNRHDSDLLKKRSCSALAALLEIQDGCPADEAWTAEELARLRNRLACDVLLADLAGSGTPLPDSLAGAAGRLPPGLASLASAWRVRIDRRDSYVTHADRVERELNLGSLVSRQASLVSPRSETFLGLERQLLRRTAEGMLREVGDGLIGLARERQAGFWASVRPDVQAQWALLATAGQLLAEADRIARELRAAPGEATGLFRAYTEGERPWCLLDTHQRHLERRCHAFDFDLGGGHAELQQLIARARQRYTEVSSDLSERFLRLYQRGKFRLAGVPRQAETFRRTVRPGLGKGKIGYVWVDALRFEMARELASLLEGEFTVQLEAATATAPTITEIGMAALLPGAEEAARVVSPGAGRLGLEIGGATVKDRKDRVSFLRRNAGVAVCDARLDELLPSPRKRVRESVASADLVLVTSQEIDALCEGDNVPLARRAMEGVLHELRRAFRLLAELGVTTLVVAADHGYLFGDELDEDMKLDDPGGEAAALHRRVWVGRGGTSEPSYMRARLDDLGLGNELELAVPWGLACFRVRGGARAYFHGGMSLQELAVPVLVLSAVARRPQQGGEVTWTLTPGSRKITTRFYSVQIAGQAAGLFEPTVTKVRVEVRAKGGVVSAPVSASYGFEESTGDVQMRRAEGDRRNYEPNTVALMLSEVPQQKAVTVLLVDAATGAELARLDKVEVDVAI
jgi:hypothetical protein